MQVSEFLAMQRQELGLGCFCVSENILGTFSGFHKILLQIGKRIEWTSRWKVWTLASTVRKEIVRRLTNRFSELSIICNNASYTCIFKDESGWFSSIFWRTVFEFCWFSIFVRFGGLTDVKVEACGFKYDETQYTEELPQFTACEMFKT